MSHDTVAHEVGAGGWMRFISGMVPAAVLAAVPALALTCLGTGLTAPWATASPGEDTAGSGPFTLDAPTATVTRMTALQRATDAMPGQDGAVVLDDWRYTESNLDSRLFFNFFFPDAFGQLLEFFVFPTPFQSGLTVIVAPVTAFLAPTVFVIPTPSGGITLIFFPGLFTSHRHIPFGQFFPNSLSF